MELTDPIKSEIFMGPNAPYPYSGPKLLVRKITIGQIVEDEILSTINMFAANGEKILFEHTLSKDILQSGLNTDQIKSIFDKLINEFNELNEKA